LHTKKVKKKKKKKGMVYGDFLNKYKLLHCANYASVEWLKKLAK